MIFHSYKKEHSITWLKVILAENETRHNEISKRLSVLPESGNPQTQQNFYEPSNVLIKWKNYKKIFLIQHKPKYFTRSTFN